MNSFSALRLFIVYASVTALASCTSSPSEQPKTKQTVRTSSETEQAVVQLSTEQAQALAIRTVQAAPDTLSYTISIPGIAEASPAYTAVVSAPLSGRVTAIYAIEGATVQRGSVLFDIESIELADMVAAYIQAAADEAYTAQQLARTDILTEKNISARRTLEKAQSEHERAVAAVRAARTRLLSLGIDNRELEQWKKGELDKPVLHVRAPMSGIVHSNTIRKGQSVAALERMSELIDPTEVFLRGFATPEDAVHIRAGAPLTVTLSEQPNRVFATAVRSLAPAVDNDNKSLVVHAVLRTPDAQLRAGQPVHMNITVHTAAPVIALPLSAIEYEGTTATVFVRLNDTAYVRQPVVIARLTTDTAIIASGLDGSESIATTGIFRLKALARLRDYSD